MSSEDSIMMLESAIVDARQGLAEDIFLFISRITPLINVDLLIQDEGRTLLTWRDDELFGSGWHLPGGIIRYKEAAEHRIQDCAREELAVEVSFDPKPLLVSETIREEQNRGHLISLLYRCRLLSPLDDASQATQTPPSRGQWRWHNTAPPDLLQVQRHYTRFF
jgi:ADP-ribose pyrophosphatase YjhB (NUDIX family)